MKKILFIVCLGFVLLLFQSCNTNIFSGTPPPCEWTGSNQVVFYDLRLNYPVDLSPALEMYLPIDKIGRSLTQVLAIKGNADFSTSKASITVNMKADGRACIGEKTIQFLKGSPNVSIGTIDVPYVSNAVFLGEVTVGLRTDIFINTIGNDSYYHVMWTATGNDPNGGVVGDIIGTKITYAFLNGTSSIVFPKQGYVIIDGQKNYF